MIFSHRILSLVLCLSCGSALALSGSGDSSTGELDTIRPTLDGLVATAEDQLQATFSEFIREPGAITPGNYAVSGPGAGSLTVNPIAVSGFGPLTLDWSGGEMRDGATVTLTATGLQDAVGNPIDTGANSASTTGVGNLPSFAGLTVTPMEAQAGETVSISFNASESLDTAPMVTVNGNPATLVASSKAISFSYEYTVLEADLVGTANVLISGLDPAGNLGTGSGAFTIVPAASPLPLPPWFMGGALLIAAVLALRLRHHSHLAGAALLLLVATTAVAQAPSVSNVAFVQQPNGGGGTEVVITYDLVSANGPSDITVALSKDGGVDGFPFPVTSVSGDVSSVTTGTGRTITWDVATDYPDEQLYNVQFRVTADDGLVVDIPELVPVASGSFDMGRTSSGDDATHGQPEELPVHTVTLSAYEIGKFEVTNQQVCDVFNWADDQGLFTTVNANTATAFGQELLDLDAFTCHIEYVAGAFQPESRTGDPGAATPYGTADHPVVAISWYGAVAYCNWLSQIFGLTPVYNTATWAATFSNDGYRLPTEAQWERAAAWDGSKHWIYGHTSDTLSGKDSANYSDGSPDFVNPLGLTTYPNTAPVGWFDGVNVSPNGTVATSDAASPVGAYDMTGSVWEWCHDWYDAAYYGTSPAADPEGAASGANRVLRGGAWSGVSYSCRAALRFNATPASALNHIGFRIAK